MRRALELASRCAEHGDVPIGAVVVRHDQEIGAAGNERELRGDPTAHAELLAVRHAAAAAESWRLDGCNLVQDPRLNHEATLVSGVLADECGDLLRAFFRARR